MPHRKHIPGTPQEWLARAHGDLSLAESELPEDGFYEDLCFHAQQAAEKALKAVILECGGDFPYTHDIDELFVRIRNANIHVPPSIDKAVDLNVYAFDTRYPHVYEPVTEKEYLRAIKLARTIVNWAEEQLERTRCSP